MRSFCWSRTIARCGSSWLVAILERMIDWSDENNINVKDKLELKDLIQKKKLLLVAEDLKERMGNERLRRFLKEVFSEWTEPGDTQQLLPKLPFAAAITTNYDRLLEMAYAKQRRLPDVFTQENTPSLMSSLRCRSFSWQYRKGGPWPIVR